MTANQKERCLQFVDQLKFASQMSNELEKKHVKLKFSYRAVHELTQILEEAAARAESEEA